MDATQLEPAAAQIVQSPPPKRARTSAGAGNSRKENRVEEEGFCKLWGKSFDDPDNPSQLERILNSDFPITLGRDFKPESGSYALTNIAKNRVWVNNTLVDEGATVGLAWGDAVRMGRTCFYFLPPKHERPKEAYLDLAIECLTEQGPSTGRQIAMWLLGKFPYFNVKFGNTPGLVGLTRSVQQAIAKCERIEQKKEKRIITYSLAPAASSTPSGTAVESASTE